MRKMNPLGRSSGVWGCVCRGLRLAAALALGGMPVWLYAGSFVTDFNLGLPPGSAVFGDSVVSANDGQGSGYTNSGCLQLTGGIAGTNGAFIIESDLDGGTPVVSFTAAFKVLLAGGSNAKGFSFNFAPDLPVGPISVDGAGSGLTVEFDTLLAFPPDTAPAVDVEVGGVRQAGAFFEGLRAGVWVDAVIQLNPNNTLDVVFDGTYIFSNLDLAASSHVPAAGSLFGFGATAGETADNQFIDDLNIVTSVSPAPYVQSYAPRGRQAQTNSAIDIVLTDNLTQVNPASVVLTLDGAVAASAVTRKGKDTQIHFAPPVPFPYSSLHSVALAFSDNATPAPQHFTWSYTFGVAGAPFVPGSYVALFTEGFESYALGALDKNPLYWVSGNGPNYAPNGSGNPWFGRMPPNAQVMSAVDGVLPHGGTNMLGGGTPGEQDLDWLNLAYRVGDGRAFKSDCRLDWWFYDPLGNAPNAADFEDYVALCSYDTAPTNTDYPESTVPEDNANLDTGLVQDPNYQRLCLGASATIPAGGAYDSSKYQARIIGSPVGYADGWIDTPRQRTAGWHHACIILGPLLPDGTATAYFYIDDLVTPVFSGNSRTTNGFNVIEINSAQENSVGYFDDISFSVVGSAPSSTALAVTRAGNALVLTWKPGWILQAASSPEGPWNDVQGATSPYTFNPTPQHVLFFRLRNGSTPASTTLSIARSGRKLVLTWQSVSTLQSAPALKGPWNDLPGAASPYTYDPVAGSAQFFRLRN